MDAKWLSLEKRDRTADGEATQRVGRGEPQCRRKNQLHTRSNWPFPNTGAEKDG